MPLNLSLHTRRALPPAALVALLALLGSGLQSNAAAQNGNGPACSVRTLRGAYGLAGSGVRALGPGASESFVTISMVTYDGHGNFTAEGVSHGQITGVREAPVHGTYFVNPDCTGGETTFIPGVPPLEDRFVIVDNGLEVRTVVVSPVSTIGSANLRKR
jgi:hypothetical protein